MEDYFRQSLQTDPKNLNARFYLGEILAARAWSALRYEDFDDAVSYLEEAVEYAPERRDLYYSLGAAYEGLEENQKAAAAYRRYVVLGGANPRVLSLLDDAP